MLEIRTDAEMRVGREKIKERVDCYSCGEYYARVRMVWEEHEIGTDA